MCLDCAFGSCNGNTTVCICDAGYSQSSEFFDFQGLVCLQENVDLCLPCDTRTDVIFGLYCSGAVMNIIIVAVLLYGLDTRSRLLRHSLIVIALACIAVADLIRVANPSAYFGENVAFTLFYSYGLLLGFVAIIQYARRFLIYIDRTVVVFNSKRSRSAARLVIQINLGVQGVLVLIGVMPVIAAALPSIQNKAALILPYLYASSSLLLYALIVDGFAYFTLIRDLELLIERSSKATGATERYSKALAKIKTKRAAELLIYIPVCVVLFLAAAVPQVYRVAQYLLPFFNTAVPLVLLWLRFTVGYRPPTEKTRSMHQQEDPKPSEIKTSNL